MQINVRGREIWIPVTCQNQFVPGLFPKIMAGNAMPVKYGLNIPGITESDWSLFLGHAGDTFGALGVPPQECEDVTAFVLSLKDDIVEA